MRKVTRKQTVLDGKFNTKNALSFEDQMQIRGGANSKNRPIVKIKD